MRNLRLKKANGNLPEVICLVSGEDEGCKARSATETPATGRVGSCPTHFVRTPFHQAWMPLGIVESITTSRYYFPHSPLCSGFPLLQPLLLPRVQPSVSMRMGLSPKTERPKHGDISPIVRRSCENTPQLAKSTGVGVREPGATHSSWIS